MISTILKRFDNIYPGMEFSTITHSNILETLRRIDFLDPLRIDELERLCSLVSKISLDEDTHVYTQDDHPDAFYIIEQGEVEISVETKEGREIVANFSRAGDFFGERALVDSLARTASVRTLQVTDFLVIHRTDFDRLIEDSPEIHSKIIEILSQGKRQSDSYYVEQMIEKNLILTEALQNLETAQEELLRRERLSLVGKLASGIIHDLKKPMTCISGYAQLLGVRKVSEDKRHRYAEKITDEVHRLVNMVNEILHFSKGEQQIDKQLVDARDWLDSCTELLDRDFEESGISFVKDLKHKGKILIDPERFKSVIFNIAANASSAMSEGGTFTIIFDQEGDYYRLDFIDDGIGMGNEAKARVFKEFFSQRKDGTGLGMAIVKRIVEGHNGTITVESQLGDGTQFTILLPLEDE
ncbi:cyclic nucleotide-binding domain-containing protein [bacterium]|nr:cyclic nucleotide-binding domain-containing protein [bacterium]